MGRPLDPSHPSNRYVVVATVLAGLGTLSWRWSTDAGDIWLWSLRVAAAVFLAWAVGREIDPDDTLSAGVATAVVVPFMALGAPSLLSTAAILMAARVAVRTTGISPHLIDGAALTIGAVYLGARPETWPALGTLILAVGTDRLARPAGPERTLWFGAAMTLAAMTTAVAFADPPGWDQPTIPEWAVLGFTAAAGFLAAINTRPLVTRADYHDHTLSESRLRFGRVLVFFTLVVGTVYLGGPIVPSLTPVWAATLSVTLVHYYRIAANRSEAA
jgi:hypothetical protein